MLKLAAIGDCRISINPRLWSAGVRLLLPRRTSSLLDRARLLSELCVLQASVAPEPPACVFDRAGSGHCQPAQLDVLVESFELLPIHRFHLYACGRGDVNRCYDFAGCGHLDGARGEIDDGAEDVAVAQEHLAACHPGSYLGNDRMVCKGC
jgi:hypothetical protein